MILILKLNASIDFIDKSRLHVQSINEVEFLCDLYSFIRTHNEFSKIILWFYSQKCIFIQIFNEVYLM